MKWISVKDSLPDNKEYVFAYAGNYIQSMKYTVVQFCEGNTPEECERVNLYRGCDQHGNNLVPYNWEEFGPMSFFGQDITHWSPLPKAPEQ